MIIRGLGLVFLMLTVLAIGADVWRSLDAGALIIQSLGERWYTLDQDSLNLSQAIIQRYIWPTLWDPGVTTFLLWPSWVLPALLTLGFLWWSRE